MRMTAYSIKNKLFQVWLYALSIINYLLLLLDYAYRNYLCAMKILMVCLGNICRSPMAEAILQYHANKAGLQWTVESAGTNGYHNGEPPHPLSIKIALQNGLDIQHQKSRQFTAADFDKYDKIYAMAKDVITAMKHIAKDKSKIEKTAILLNELHPGSNQCVSDPWSGPEKGYHETFEIIEQACKKIVQRQVDK